MFQPSTKKFFLYGLAVAGLEEFITQGVLKNYVFYFPYFRSCGRSMPLVPHEPTPTRT